VEAVLAGMSGSRRDQPMEFIESRKEVEAMARPGGEGGGGGVIGGGDLLADDAPLTSLVRVGANRHFRASLQISNAPQNLIVIDLGDGLHRVGAGAGGRGRLVVGAGSWNGEGRQRGLGRANDRPSVPVCKLPAAVEGSNAERAGDFVQMIPDRPVWRWGRGCLDGRVLGEQSS